MRTFDMLQVAPPMPASTADLFSLEMWGGATFDTSMRFLKESPWERLADLRERMPNILFQMLLRAANAVGYTNYPDNVVKEFVKQSARTGIDLFRIFDALNWLPNMQLAIDAVRTEGMLCEAAICYTGDILDPEANEIQPEVLRQPGQAVAKSRRESARHQGHGRHLQAVRRPATGARPAAGNRHPDSFPHARFCRRADRDSAARGRGGRRYRRYGDCADGGDDQPAESEHTGRGAAQHSARSGIVVSGSEGYRGLLGGGPKVLSPVREWADRAERRGL